MTSFLIDEHSIVKFQSQNFGLIIENSDCDYKRLTPKHLVNEVTACLLA